MKYIALISLLLLTGCGSASDGQEAALSCPPPVVMHNIDFDQCSEAYTECIEQARHYKKKKFARVCAKFYTVCTGTDVGVFDKKDTEE